MSVARWDWPMAGAPLRPLDALAPPVVWRVELDACPPTALQGASAILSLGEQERAAAFRFEADRRQYVAAHLALRYVLAAYVGRSPEGLTFSHSPYGKPSLAQGAPRFNLSHAAGAMLVAVHPCHAVGVDVEPARPPFPIEGLIPRVLTEGEAVALRAQPPEARGATFMRYWTCKEAILKASGDGLQQQPSDVAVDPFGPRVTIRHLPPSYPPRDRWHLRSWDEGEHVAALAWIAPA